MSSTERAPEPTMEEILASIRRIISDEEAKAPQQTSPAADEEYHLGTPDPDANYEVEDTQIIDDLARVLSGGGQGEPALELSEDDILDLDEALEATPAEEFVATEDYAPAGEYAPAEEYASLEEFSTVPDFAPTEELAPDEIVGVEETVIIEAYEEPRRVDFAAAFPPFEESVSRAFGAPTEQEASATEAASISEETLSTEDGTTPAESFEPDAPAAFEPPAEEVVVVAAPPPLTLDDPTSALERAIAALKAGDLSAFAREADPTYGLGAAAQTPAKPAPIEQPPVEAASQPEPQPEPLDEPFEQAHPVVAAENEPVHLQEPSAPETQAPEMEEDVALAGDAAPESEPGAISEPEPEFQTDTEPASDWNREESAWSNAAPMPIKDFLPNGSRGNGGAHKQHHEFEEPVASKSLEDSVKEMLRPMLRQWLDENMNRVLTTALREELENEPERRPTPRRGN